MASNAGHAPPSWGAEGCVAGVAGYWELSPNTSILCCVLFRVKAPIEAALARLFGSKLRYLRQQAQLTQTELAHALGLSRHGHITNLETGQDAPSLDLIIRTARHFGVSLDYLLRDVVAVEAVAHLSPSYTDSTSLQPFGAKLRSFRDAKRWSQGELARRLGLARGGYISNLETGRKQPSPELAVQIADTFGVGLDMLLRDDLPFRQKASY